MTPSIDPTSVQPGGGFWFRPEDDWFRGEEVAAGTSVLLRFESPP